MSRPRKPLPPDLAAGAFTVGQGRAAGLGDERLRGPDLDRPFRGVRVPRDAPPIDGGALADRGLPAPPADLLDRCAALAVALGDEPVFSHLTAALLWPVPLPRLDPDEDLHICVAPPDYRPRRKGVRAHKLLDRNVRVVFRHGRRMVDPGTLFCQLATVLSPEDLVAVGDALVLAPRRKDPCDDRPWLTLRQLTERVESYRGRGKVNASRAVRMVRPGAESRPETLVRLAIVDAGLPEPEVNGEIHSLGGWCFSRCGDPGFS